MNRQKRSTEYYGQLLGNAARKEELDVDKASCCIQLRNINKKIIRNMYNNEMIILLPMGASVSETLYSDVLYLAVMLYLAVNLFKRIIRAIPSFLNNPFLLGS